MIKKCPVCNSTKFKRKGGAMVCEKCGYIWRKKSMDFCRASDLT